MLLPTSAYGTTDPWIDASRFRKAEVVGVDTGSPVTTSENLEAQRKVGQAWSPSRLPAVRMEDDYLTYRSSLNF